MAKKGWINAMPNWTAVFDLRRRKMMKKAGWQYRTRKGQTQMRYRGKK